METEDQPAQCPECNRYSDRSEYVQLADPDPHGGDAPRYACLAYDCAATTFRKGSRNALLLNVEGIREDGKTVAEVKRDKLEHYDHLNFDVL